MSKTTTDNLPAMQAEAGLPAEYVDFGADAGRGLEGASRSELLTPFLTQLHYQCPQLEEGGENYVEGARPGMLFNTVTKQVYDGVKVGVEIVPVARESVFTEWEPDRGGFRGARPITDPEVLRLRKEQGSFKKLITDEGTELVEQFNLFLLYAPSGEPITADNAQEAVIAFTSTRIAPYREFFSIANAIRYPSNNGSVTPPLWAHRWVLRTLPKKNDQGAWFTYSIKLIDPTPKVTMPMKSLVKMSDPLYVRARSFNELLRSGTVSANYEAAVSSDATATDDEHIPF